MIPLRRREMLGGLAASLALPAIPARAQSRDDMRLRTLLDGLSEIPDYAQRLAGLDAVDVASLSPSAAIDLRTVRNTIAIDSQLSRLVPGGKPDIPYRLPRASGGMRERPNGAAAYALLLERHVGERVTPETAHRRFEREADRLNARALRLMEAHTGFKGSVAARFKAMFADPAALYPDDAAGRDAAVADMNAWLDGARKGLAERVGPVPAVSLDVSVRRMRPAEEAAGKQGYRQIPSATQSGIYVVDLKEIRRRPRWTLGSVVHHELLPGHMVQLPIEAAANPHPLRLACLPAFAEGWAVHAEQMMADGGAYRRRPLDELGHIHWLLFRVVRGLIDTGIHHRGWSRDQARAELDRRQGVPAYFAPFDSDIERIVGDPALRAAEALVWLGLADRTRGLRGAALRRIHQRILAGGRKPLALLPNVGSEV